MLWPRKNDYLEIYKASYNNAISLLNESKLLFDQKYYQRAYFLAFTALEEISKSQFAADVFTGLEKEGSFRKFFMNHKAKISGVRWAHINADSYPHNMRWIGPDIDDIEIINPQEPDFQKRLNALYVGVDFKSSTIILPNHEINKKDAKEIIHIGEMALLRIWENSVYYGNQIGTKGFLK